MRERPFSVESDRLAACADSIDTETLCSGSGSSSRSKSAESSGSPSCNHEQCWSLFVEHATRFGRQVNLPEDGGENTSQLRYSRFLQSVLFVHQHNQNQETAKKKGKYHHSFQATLNRFSDLIDPICGANGGSGEGWRNHSRSLYSEQDGSPSPWAVGHGSLNKLNPHLKKKSTLIATNRVLHIPWSNALPFQALPRWQRKFDGYIVRIARNHDEEEASSATEDAFKHSLNWATTDNPDGVAIVHDAVDQGSCGSCWALAATGSLEASAARQAALETFDKLVKKKKNKKKTNTTAVREHALVQAREAESYALKQQLNLSIQELIDCDTTADQGCTGGNPLLAFHFIHRYGLVGWGDYPYVGHEQETCQLLNNNPQEEDEIQFFTGNNESSSSPLPPRTSRRPRPVASVQAWGIINSNHESHMELALRYLGPIAVGINGAAPSFMLYQGGIYNARAHECDPHVANHALLIVGYGRAKVKDPSFGTEKTVKYWIARNSWGPDWGEQGFVRIQRQGKKGHPGVCGIATNPSVALGGHLLSPSDIDDNNDDGRSALRDLHDPVFVYCSQRPWAHRSTCLKVSGFVFSHKAWVLGAIGTAFMFLALWLLTLDYRRRQKQLQRRRQRREQEQLEQQHTRNLTLQRQPPPREGSPLLLDARHRRQYTLEDD